MSTFNIISGIIIPILTFLGGVISTHFVTAKQYKKNVQVSLEPDKCVFKVYNTGNTRIIIKEIGIVQGKKLLFSMPINRTLASDDDPMIIPYDEEHFWLTVESVIADGPINGKFHCFATSTKKKKYKTLAPMNLSKLWNYHEWYWGRDPYQVKSSNDDLPF